VAGIVGYLLGATQSAATLLFWPLVVAFGAYSGGWSAGAVATLAAVVAMRLSGTIPASTSALFIAEGLVLTGIVVKLTTVIRKQSLALDAANARIDELQQSDRRGHAIDVAAAMMEAPASEFGLVLLDRQGHIAEWRAGTERLYGHRAETLIGGSAAVLFGGPSPEAAFEALLADAAGGTGARTTAPQRHADGTVFDADIELASTSPGGGEGFVMLVRDKTAEQQRQAVAAAAAEAQRALRQEADVAQRHLATLQAVTDPSLNGWSPSNLIAELLGRVRDAVRADGIAVVLVRGLNAPRILPTRNGLHPEGVADKSMPELAGSATSRVIFVQNDHAQVVERSLLKWPKDVASLISVPVVLGGTVEGVVEVVDRRGRRSTEWEIALLQVVAARVAGLVGDRGHMGVGVTVASPLRLSPP